VGPTTAPLKKKYPDKPTEPIEVFERTLRFTAYDVESALAQIGEWFNGPTVEGKPVKHDFEFVADEHLFYVSVEPL